MSSNHEITFPPSLDIVVGSLLMQAGDIRIVGRPGTGKTELIEGVLARLGEVSGWEDLPEVRPTSADTVHAIRAQVARAQAQGERFVLVLDGVTFPDPRVEGELRITTALSPEAIETPQVLLGGDRPLRIFPYRPFALFFPLTYEEEEEPGFETLRNVIYRTGHPTAEISEFVFEVALPETVVTLYCHGDGTVPLSEAGWLAVEANHPLDLPDARELASGEGPESLLAFLADPLSA